MPIRQRLFALQPILGLWLAVMIIGILGALIQFRRDHPLALLPQLVTTPTPPPEPLLQPSQEYPLPPVTAAQLWIYDRASGSLIYEQNAHTATSVASLAKLMTAYVAYESYDLTDTLEVGPAASVEGNRAKFLTRDVFTVRDLLQALLMFSANDAAETLAQGEDDTQEEVFVQRMNVLSQDLGMKQTHFQNVTGLDHPDQYSSASDIGTLVNTALEVPFISQTVRQTTTTVTEVLTQRRDTIYTTNTLLYRDPHYTGVKTGTTEQAGQSLVFRIEDTWSLPFRDSEEQVDQPIDIVVVILGSQDRYIDAQALTEWLKAALRVRGASRQTGEDSLS